MNKEYQISKGVLSKYLMLSFLLLISFSISAQVKKPATSQTKPAAKKTIVLKDREPSYPGGLDSLRNFIRRNLKYPEKELYDDVSGVVIVKCVVWEDGHLSDFEVIQSVTKDIDAEAIRIVKLMPKWTPGVQKGKIVPMVMKLPLHFGVK